MTRDEWEGKYQADDAHWDHGGPSPGLVDFLQDHPMPAQGAVLVPGCGTGHDVRAWACAGFQARGIDFAPSAVRRAKHQTSPTAGRATFELADFLNDSPVAPFDIIWEHTLFCAINPSERDQYVEAVLRWLKPGGTYLAVNYIVCEPEGPPWPVTARELWERFMPHFDLIDKWVPRSYPSRCGRELMSWWRRRDQLRAKG